MIDYWKNSGPSCVIMLVRLIDGPSTSINVLVVRLGSSAATITVLLTRSCFMEANEYGTLSVLKVTAAASKSSKLIRTMPSTLKKKT